MRLAMQIVILVLLAGGLAVGWSYLAGSGNDGGVSRAGTGTGDGTLVLTEPVALVDDRVLVRAIGTGMALRSVLIFPSVSGAVQEIDFRPGRPVSEGQRLLRLDDAHQRLAVQLAQVEVNEARREVTRLNRLKASGAVSQVRLEAAQAALQSADLRLELAKADLSDRSVFAPFDGVMGLSDIDKGDRVTPDMAIATLDDRASVLVEFNVPEEFSSRLHVGDPITVAPWTGSKERVNGRIAATGSRIDAATRSLKVRALIPNADDRLRPGTSFEVELAFQGQAYPGIREVAVLWSRNGAYIWRVADGRAEKVFVKIVRRDRGRVLVDGPLQPGDLIVVEGVQGLREGQALRAEPFDGPAAVDSGSGRKEGRS
mgnify:CR=1 FL=1